MGDFNYSHQLADSSFLSSPSTWRDFLDSLFFNCFSSTPSETNPTFRRGTVSSSIDYIYSSPSLYSFCSSPDITFVNSNWTDHALLSLNIQLGAGSTGRGLWRAHPALAASSEFQAHISSTLQSLLGRLQDNLLFPTVQDKWEEIKASVKSSIQQYCRSLAQKRQTEERKLQRQRNKILQLWRHSTSSAPDPQLNIVEQRLNQLQATR
ncbi:hypothetical protein DFQ29_003426, partial [Apophysomyces sp. BC1021]